MGDGRGGVLKLEVRVSDGLEHEIAIKDMISIVGVQCRENGPEIETEIGGIKR